MVNRTRETEVDREGGEEERERERERERRRKQGCGISLNEHDIDFVIANYVTIIHSQHCVQSVIDENN